MLRGACVLMVLAMGGLAWGAEPTLAERAAAIESVSTQSDGARVVVGHLSRTLHIPSDTLKAQRAQTGLSWGELLIANHLSGEKGLTFAQVVAEFRSGKSWEAIARDHNVNLSRLTSEVQRSQEVVEQREEDKAPHLSTDNPSGRGSRGAGQQGGGAGKGRHQSAN